MVNDFRGYIKDNEMMLIIPLQPTNCYTVRQGRTAILHACQPNGIKALTIISE